MGLLGILVGLGLLIWLAFRGWSVLLLAPAAALVAAAFGGEPLLANWTQIFMGSAARFLAQFFPIFLLGAIFGKLMEDSRSVSAVADFMTKKLGERRAMLAVVLAGAFVTYGGVSLFVAFFVLAPMAQALFRASRHSPPAHASGDRAWHFDLHDVGVTGHAVDSERHPDAVFRHDPFRCAWPRHHCLDHHAWLRPVVARARRGRQRAAPARAMERKHPSRSIRRRTMRWFASVRPPRGNSIRRRSTTDIKAIPLHRHFSLRCRLSSSSRSIF